MRLCWSSRASTGLDKKLPVAPSNFRPLKMSWQRCTAKYTRSTSNYCGSKPSGCSACLSRRSAFKPNHKTSLKRKARFLRQILQQSTSSPPLFVSYGTQLRNLKKQEETPKQLRTLLHVLETN